ncbi:45_t:CDS:2 [Paraglomus occultum]|uniref:45_t:CDS:1 n=1 Tax=Paraglomus occultum TaxID=144539 RepID=A0A9N9CUS2_9GLOM|nr:45_t:CDS:2 [Paraglomus occultum]
MPEAELIEEYFNEERHKQEPHNNEPSARSSKRYEVSSDKQTLPFKIEKKTSEKKNKLENQVFRRTEKRDKTHTENRREERYKENLYKESFNDMAQCIQALERKLTLVDQEEKLERQLRAETTSNKNKSKYRESTERREGSRRVYDVNRDSKVKQIKGDNTKVELLAEYGKSEGYNIIGIVETNIGEQEGKWINTKEYRYSSFWLETEKGKYKGSGIRLLTMQDMRNIILDSNIEQMETVTDSDHGIVWLQLDSARKRKKRREENQEEIESETDIDEEWELIAKAIQAVVNKYIPSTKTQNSKSQIRKEATKLLIYSKAKVLGRIFRKGSKDIGQSIDELEKAILNVRIEYLNTEYKTNITLLLEFWNKEYCIEIKE